MAQYSMDYTPFECILAANRMEAGVREETSQGLKAMDLIIA
jgi:hypothetical protein